MTRSSVVNKFHVTIANVSAIVLDLTTKMSMAWQFLLDDDAVTPLDSEAKTPFMRCQTISSGCDFLFSLLELKRKMQFLKMVAILLLSTLFCLYWYFASQHAKPATLNFQWHGTILQLSTKLKLHQCQSNGVGCYVYPYLAVASTFETPLCFINFTVHSYDWGFIHGTLSQTCYLWPATARCCKQTQTYLQSMNPVCLAITV